MVDFGFGTLDLDKKLLLWVSGGRDSTAMALALFDYLQQTKKKANVLLLTTYTYYNKLENLAVVDRLAEYTGFPSERVYYKGEIRAGKILNISFKTIPRAIRGKQEGCKSIKKYFLCCKALKHKPAKKYLKDIPVDSVINFLGFAKADKASHRGWRLSQIRDSSTFYRHLTEFYGHAYFYPLRDAEQDNIDAILDKHGFGDISSSGCRICPLFLIQDWAKKDPDSDKKSKRVAVKLGVDPRPDNQASVMEFDGIDSQTDLIIEIQKGLGETE